MRNPLFQGFQSLHILDSLIWKNPRFNHLAMLLSAIFITATTTGARVGELARINVEDVRPDDGGIYIRAEKTERNRIVGVPKEVLDYLVDFIENYRLKPTDQGDKSLFTWHSSTRGRKRHVSGYNSDTLRNLIRRTAADAGCRRIHSHSLRHFTGTELYRRGGDFRRVQFHLGHKDPKRTLTYVRLIDEEEARRNAELLRPFFQKELKKEVKRMRITPVSEPNSAPGGRFEVYDSIIPAL